MTAESGAEPGQKLTHHLARQRWGLADAREGSVNEPRTREEHGIRFNEKWIYFLHDGGRRLVYWHRYEFRGALLESADGAITEEGV